jgi:hypothetical protein
MQDQTDSNTPQKIHAGKLCIAASISLLLGVFLFFLLDLHSGDVSLSFEILGIVVPIFGFLAILNILSYWRSLTNPDNGSKNEGLIIKIADRFLLAGLLFGLLVLVLEFLVIFVGFLRVSGLPTLASIWLITMTLLSLIMSCISYKLYTKTSFRILSRIGAVLAILISFTQRLLSESFRASVLY